VTADVTGLAISFTSAPAGDGGGGRPLVGQVTSTGSRRCSSILEDAVQIGSITYGVGAANEAYPLHREVRRNPSAGSHTYSVSVQGTGTISTNDRIQAAVNSPAFIQVVEV
jgi:hypothetical protein